MKNSPDRDADERDLQRLRDEDHEADVHPLATPERDLEVARPLEVPDAPGQPHEQERRGEQREQPGAGVEGHVARLAEQLPVLVREERDEREEEQERQRPDEERERRAEQLDEPHDAIHRRIEKTPKPTTSQTAPSSARFARPVTSALVSWPPKTSGSTTGQHDERRELGEPRPWSGSRRTGGPAATFRMPNAPSSSASPPRSAQDVAGGRPVQVDRPEELEHEHHREQRDRPGEDVLGRRVVLGEQGQPGAPEACARARGSGGRARAGRPSPAIEPPHPARRKRPGRLAPRRQPVRCSEVGFASALVIFAHPDDAEFMCGGTVAAWANEGTEVHYCVVTDGSAGSNEPGVTREQMIPIREREQRAAAEILGVESPHLPRVPGRRARGRPRDPAGRDAGRPAVRPEVIVAPDPSRLWSRNGYINHWDHKQAGTLALCAVMPDAPSRPQFPELLDEGLEPFEIPHLWLSARGARYLRGHHEDDRPKLEALRAHVSQGVDDADVVGARAGPRARRRQAGIEYAEGFRAFDFTEDVMDRRRRTSRCGDDERESLSGSSPRRRRTSAPTSRTSRACARSFQAPGREGRRDRLPRLRREPLLRVGPAAREPRAHARRPASRGCTSPRSRSARTSTSSGTTARGTSTRSPTPASSPTTASSSPGARGARRRRAPLPVLPASAAARSRPCACTTSSSQRGLDEREIRAMLVRAGFEPF